ncbi:MAG: hypothetical protein U0841_06415 [Chloroflexia bacterium]
MSDPIRNPQSAIRNPPAVPRRAACHPPARKPERRRIRSLHAAATRRRPLRAQQPQLPRRYARRRGHRRRRPVHHARARHDHDDLHARMGGDGLFASPDPATSAALLYCAARETFEETGVLVARDEAGAYATLADEAYSATSRDDVLAGTLPFDNVLSASTDDLAR